MKKINKIEIKFNGKFSRINKDLTMLKFVKKFKIPIKKVAIELNREVIDKRDIGKIKLKNRDVVEIVHFIGGG